MGICINYPIPVPDAVINAGDLVIIQKIVPGLQIAWPPVV